MKGEIHEDQRQHVKIWLSEKAERLTLEYKVHKTGGNRSSMWHPGVEEGNKFTIVNDDDDDDDDDVDDDDDDVSTLKVENFAGTKFRGSKKPRNFCVSRV